jgi:hypothetical protein
LFYTVKQNEKVVKNLEARSSRVASKQILLASDSLVHVAPKLRGERPSINGFDNLGGAIVPALGRRWRGRD